MSTTKSGGPQEGPAGPGLQAGEHPAGWKVRERKSREPGYTPTGKPNKAMRRLMRQQQYVATVAEMAQVDQRMPVGVLESVQVGAPQGGPAGPGLLTAEERMRIRQEERRQEEERAKEEGRKPERRIRGRPSEYTQEEADVICAWISGGKSLRKYCLHTKRPMETVYRWLREHADFRDRYKLAHEDRADTLTDEMLEIADEAGAEPSIEGVAAAKLRVETRKWLASKMHRTKWGDEVKQQAATQVSIRIGIPGQGQGAPLVERVDQPALMRSGGVIEALGTAKSLIRKEI